MSDEPEEWRAIPGGKRSVYEVSSLGRIRARWRVSGGPWRYPKPWKIQDTGYLGVHIEGKRLLHRVVLESFVGPCPDGHEAAHLNGIRTDGRLANLRWVTRVENQAHKAVHDTQPRGSRIVWSKLTEDQVRRIRERHAAGERICALAREYGVCQAGVSHIVARKTWRHVA